MRFRLPIPRSLKPLKFVVSIGLLAVVITGFGPRHIADAIASARPGYLLLALAAFLASGVAGSIQWSVLLRFHGIYPGYRVALSRYFMGLFFNYLLPGFVGGDVVRIYQVSRISGKGTRAFSSTVADRVMGLLVLVMFSIGAYFYMPEGPATGALPVALLMFGVLAGFFAVAAVRSMGMLINRLFGRFIPAMFRSRIAAIYCEMHDLTRSPTTLLTVVCTATIIQLNRIGVHYFCARAVGIEVSFFWFALFVPLMEIVASVPISFGGIGVRETMGAALFGTIGILRGDVVAYTLLATLTGFVGSLPGGLAFLLSGSPAAGTGSMHGATEELREEMDRVHKETGDIAGCGEDGA